MKPKVLLIYVPVLAILAIACVMAPRVMRDWQFSELGIRALYDCHESGSLTIPFDESECKVRASIKRESWHNHVYLPFLATPISVHIPEGSACGDAVRMIAGLESLRRIQIDGAVQSIWLNEFRSRMTLEELVVAVDNSGDAESLALTASRCNSLRYLTITGAPMTSKGLSGLESHPLLSWLVIDGSELLNDEIVAFIQHNPSLRVLSIGASLDLNLDALKHLDDGVQPIDVWDKSGLHRVSRSPLSN